MKKAIRVLALIMIACFALCVFAACDMSGGEKPSEEPSHTHSYTNGVCVCGEIIYTVVDEDTILFGSYPQSEVSDTTIISTLSASAGTLPTSSNSASWTSYGYYINGSVQKNYMWYIDLENSEEKYRGVYFTSYRPHYTTGSSSHTYQESYGYSAGTVYWFKYEPISWTVLDKDEGLILCDMIIDSQAYQNEYEYNNNSTEKKYIKGTNIYANNYEYSTIRAWLNDTFYNTAFNALQKEKIKTTQVDNSVASMGYTSNPYVCNDTYDKVVLLSYSEVTNTSYGFSSNASENDTARRKKTTAYAQSQGVYTFGDTSSSYFGNGLWWLRSPSSYGSGGLACGVGLGGSVGSGSAGVSYTILGVVPALQIQLLL